MPRTLIAFSAQCETGKDSVRDEAVRVSAHLAFSAQCKTGEDSAIDIHILELL